MTKPIRIEGCLFVYLDWTREKIIKRIEEEQDILNALIPVHMVPLPSIQFSRVDSIAFDIFVLYLRPPGDPC